MLMKKRAENSQTLVVHYRDVQQIHQLFFGFNKQVAKTKKENSDLKFYTKNIIKESKQIYFNI